MHHSFLTPEPQGTVMRGCIPADASQHDEHMKHKMLRFNTANSCTGRCFDAHPAAALGFLRIAGVTSLPSTALGPWVLPRLLGAAAQERTAQGREFHERTRFKAPSLQLQSALHVLLPKASAMA